MADDPTLVYSDDRVRRLRIALGLGAGLCTVFGVLALLGAGQREEARTIALLLGLVGLVGAAWCVVAWRLLAVPVSRVKRLVVVIGAILVFLGLLTGPVVLFSLPFALLGLTVIFLALISDEVS